jgi:hypothetical protein
MNTTLKRCLLAGLICLLIAAVPVWSFCLRAVPLRISKETTYVTEPLTADGKRVDYFRAMEIRLYPPEMKTDDNAYRMILRSFGPPDDLPVALCTQFYEKLGLDPDVEPTFTIELPTFCKKKDYKTAEIHDELRKYWSPDEYPELTDWLTENSAAIDALAEAVRKPVFCVPMVRENEQTTGCDVRTSSQFNIYARAVSGRANYRISIGDIDGAIEDTLTVHRLGRHLAGPRSFFGRFLGTVFMEGLLAQSIALAGNPDHPPTKAQLEYLLRELDRLPRRATLNEILEGERLFVLGALDHFFENPREYYDQGCCNEMYLLKWTPPIFDANVIYTIINQAFDTRGDADYDKRASWNPLRYLTVQSRSEQVAHGLVNITTLGSDATQTYYQKAECSARLKRLTLALLLYEAEHGSMPVGDWREAIKPYLGEVPVGYFGCPTEKAGYALVLTDTKTPETLLLVETKWEDISDDGTIASDSPPFGVHREYYSTNISYRSGAVRAIQGEW